MNVHIELLRPGMNLSTLLKKDGWTPEGGLQSFSFSHPHVLDEEAARIRLTRLGILTSGAMRIEFERDRVSPRID